MTAPSPLAIAASSRPSARSTSRAHGCPVGELLRFLGKPYVLGILRVFSEEPGAHRFVGLQRKLEISPNTLTARLHELVEAGFLTRTAYNEIPPRVDYAATQKTREIEEIFEVMSDWAKRNDLKPTPVVDVGRRPVAGR